MNEPKQITGEEFAEYFRTGNEYYNSITFQKISDIARANGWIKPDPTPEEEFSEWLSNDLFIDDIFAEDLAIIESKTLEAMAKIRKEYEDGK
jgi:hypothetical protein